MLRAAGVALLAVLGFGSVGVISVLLARATAGVTYAELEWPLAFLFFGLLGAASARGCAAFAYRPARLVSAVREIVPPDESVEDFDFRRALGHVAEALTGMRADARRYETILANMADGVIAVDERQRITLLNNSAGLLFNVDSDGLLGRDLQDADLHPELARLASECIATGKTLRSEIRLPGVQERSVGLRAAPMADSTGAENVIIMLHDLSEVRRHEKNQREFVSNVSHELKTPVTAVRVSAEALLSGAKDDSHLVDRFLNNIVSESDRISALIEDLLDIARRDAGLTVTEKNDVGLAALVDSVVRVITPQVEQKGLVLRVAVQEGLTGWCDSVQIRQLVQNLADNAVKYTPDGGEIEIGARQLDGKLEISIADTGIGIPQGELPRIFERFYRVDKARSRRLGGTGLGLAIVKDIADAHGGEIRVETKLGEGSTFSVLLPARPEGADGDDESEEE